MRISKKSFKTFLATCATLLVVAGIHQEFVLNRENKFKRVKTESVKDSDEDIISCSELANYEVVEMKKNNESQLYIAKANNFNDDDKKIYYDIFTGEDIIGDNEDSFITSTPIEYYLYGDNIKEEYTKEEIQLLFNNIKENYDYEEVMTLRKEM